MLVGTLGFVLGRWSLRRDLRSATQAVERRLAALETRSAAPTIVVQTPTPSPPPSSSPPEVRSETAGPEAGGRVAPLFVPILAPRGQGAQSADAGVAGEPDGGLAPSAEVEPREEVSRPAERKPEEERPVRCGATWCGPGLLCCNADCGLCAPPGVACSQRMCSVIPAPVSVLCGMTTCNVGYDCCNPSCGTCVPAGQTCDPKPCDTSLEFPFSEMCGMTTCNTGFECCNPSCGTCVRPGESCSREPCGW